MQMARRMQCRIPAFGEWNNLDADADDEDWSVTQRFDSAMGPPLPAHKPIKRARARARRRRIPAFGQWNMDSHGDGGGVWPAAVNQCFEFKPAMAHKPLDKVRRDGNGAAMGKQHNVKVQSRVADPGAHAGREPISLTAVKAVDNDLYGVPPDMLCHKPTGKGGRWLRSLLMGCVGLNCIA